MAIELPKDAEGKAIPLDTQMLYRENGEQVSVYRFLFYPRTNRSFWIVEITGRETFNPRDLYLNKPDTLKQLAADLDCVATHPTGCACAYLNRVQSDCEGCKFKNEDSCIHQFVLDVTKRVHRLAGDAE